MMTAAKIVETVPWIDARYYAATQTMDEARHTEVFAKYLHTKLGEAYPMSPFLEEQITNLLEDSRWDIAYLGMQIVIESLALAAFGTMLRNTEEPLLKKLLRYVMSDEARRGLRRAQPGGVLPGPVGGRAEGQAGVPHRAPSATGRSTTPEIWERMGISAELVPFIIEGAGKIKIILRRLPGVLLQARAQRPQARPARRQRRLPAHWEEAGLLEFEFADDTGTDYASYDAVAQDRGCCCRRIVTARTLRGAAALVGAADIASPTGELDTHGRALEVAMIRQALDDAGLTLDDVDGVACAGQPAGLAEYLGIRPRYLDGTTVGGSSYELHVEHAAAAIAAGLCDVVVGVYASTPRSNRRRPDGGGRVAGWAAAGTQPRSRGGALRAAAAIGARTAATWRCTAPRPSSSPRSRSTPGAGRP